MVSSSSGWVGYSRLLIAKMPSCVGHEHVLERRLVDDETGQVEALPLQFSEQGGNDDVRRGHAKTDGRRVHAHCRHAGQAAERRRR